MTFFVRDRSQQFGLSVPIEPNHHMNSPVIIRHPRFRAFYAGHGIVNNYPHREPTFTFIAAKAEQLHLAQARQLLASGGFSGCTIVPAR